MRTCVSSVISRFTSSSARSPGGISLPTPSDARAAMSQVVGFRVGAEFSSYNELHREYRRYQRDSSVQMWTRHSRTIKAQRRRAPKRPMNDALNFAEIDYACIHGGKLFKTKGSGKRTIQRTNKMKCPCVIKVRLSADGNKFVVKEMNESHNHTVPQVNHPRALEFVAGVFKQSNLNEVAKLYLITPTSSENALDHRSASINKRLPLHPSTTFREV
ncbi:uncharacterized protein LOC144602553 [Rhinoraja longicauda]